MNLRATVPADGRQMVLFSVNLLLAVVLLTGCGTTKTSDPARTATEQLLLSTATDHALATANLKIFANRKVFVDAANFDSYDAKYVVGSIRDVLSRAGALLEDSMTNSDIIVEARSGALSTDSSDSLFGIPSLGVPVPLAGTLQTPQVGIYVAHRQESYAKIALLAFTQQSRSHVYSSGPLEGKSLDQHSRFLFVGWHRTDLPEKQTTAKKTAGQQTWQAQYDLTNMPPLRATNAAPRQSP